MAQDRHVDFQERVASKDLNDNFRYTRKNHLLNGYALSGNAASFNVSIASGVVLVRGVRISESTAIATLDEPVISTPDVTNPRIDVVIIDYDRAPEGADSVATYSVIAGTPAANPVPPLPSSLTNHQTIIGYIYVPASAADTAACTFYGVSDLGGVEDVTNKFTSLGSPGITAYGVLNDSTGTACLRLHGVDTERSGSSVDPSTVRVSNEGMMHALVLTSDLTLTPTDIPGANFVDTIPDPDTGSQSGRYMQRVNMGNYRRSGILINDTTSSDDVSFAGQENVFGLVAKMKSGGVGIYSETADSATYPSSSIGKCFKALVRSGSGYEAHIEESSRSAVVVRSASGSSAKNYRALVATGDFNAVGVSLVDLSALSSVTAITPGATPNLGNLSYLLRMRSVSDSLGGAYIDADGDNANVISITHTNASPVDSQTALIHAQYVATKAITLAGSGTVLPTIYAITATTPVSGSGINLISGDVNSPSVRGLKVDNFALGLEVNHTYNAGNFTLGTEAGVKLNLTSTVTGIPSAGDPTVTNIPYGVRVSTATNAVGGLRVDASDDRAVALLVNHTNPVISNSNTHLVHIEFENTPGMLLRGNGTGSGARPTLLINPAPDGGTYSPGIEIRPESQASAALGDVGLLISNMPNGVQVLESTGYAYTASAGNTLLLNGTGNFTTAATTPIDDLFATESANAIRNNAINRLETFTDAPSGMNGVGTLLTAGSLLSPAVGGCEDGTIAVLVAMQMDSGETEGVALAIAETPSLTYTSSSRIPKHSMVIARRNGESSRITDTNYALYLKGDYANLNVEGRSQFGREITVTADNEISGGALDGSFNNGSISFGDPITQPLPDTDADYFIRRNNDPTNPNFNNRSLDIIGAGNVHFVDQRVVVDKGLWVIDDTGSLLTPNSSIHFGSPGSVIGPRMVFDRNNTYGQGVGVFIFYDQTNAIIGTIDSTNGFKDGVGAVANA